MIFCMASDVAPWPPNVWSLDVLVLHGCQDCSTNGVWHRNGLEVIQPNVPCQRCGSRVGHVTGYSLSDWLAAVSNTAYVAIVGSWHKACNQPCADIIEMLPQRLGITMTSNCWGQDTIAYDGVLSTIMPSEESGIVGCHPYSTGGRDNLLVSRDVGLVWLSNGPVGKHIQQGANTSGLSNDL